MPNSPPFVDFDANTRHLRLDPRQPEFFQDPYKAYAWLHRAAPIFFWEDFGFWCAGGFETVNKLLRDRRFGRQSPHGVPDSRSTGADRSHLANFDRVEAGSLLELEPPEHTRLRTLVNRAFVSRQVERLRPRIERLAHDLIDAFGRTGSTDLLASFATPLPITIIAEMLGVPTAMAPKLLDWSHTMVAMYAHGRNAATERAADDAARQFSDYLRGLVADKRKKPEDDLITLLITARDEGRKLDDNELVSSVILLLNAGHEATVHQMGNAIKAIHDQGGDPRRFFATPEAAAATVEECLRFDAPLHMFTRYAYEDIDLGNGAAIGSGEQVGLLLGMANRDPAAYSNPDLFDPDRTDQKNVSFGAGIHFCIGAPLARLELQVGLKVLFDRLPGLRLQASPSYRDSYHFHGLERLDCTW